MVVYVSQRAESNEVERFAFVFQFTVSEETLTNKVSKTFDQKQTGGWKPLYL